jgi:hypothetical protein
MFSNVSANLAAVIFRVNDFGRGFGGFYIALASGSLSELKLQFDEQRRC